MTPKQLYDAIPDVPRRVLNRPICTKRGIPIPWFVTIRDGEADFTFVNPRQLQDCLVGNICWICGERLAKYRAYIQGPMGFINRISMEGWMHGECARFAVRACPFMVNPEMKRPSGGTDSGSLIARNVQITLIRHFDYNAGPIKAQIDSAGHLIVESPLGIRAEAWAKGERLEYGRAITEPMMAAYDFIKGHLTKELLESKEPLTGDHKAYHELNQKYIEAMQLLEASYGVQPQ